MSKKLTFVMLALFGFGYFGTISILEFSYFWKSEIALIPIQLIAIVYITYLRLSRS